MTEKSITYEVTVDCDKTVWRLDGKIHREDGPAIEYASGDKEWWLNGEKYTEKEFLAKTRPVKELTIAEVEKLLGYPVKIVK